jgi:hypothetical protein
VNTSNISIKDIDGRINGLTGQISKLPATQRLTIAAVMATRTLALR